MKVKVCLKEREKPYLTFADRNHHQHFPQQLPLSPIACSPVPLTYCSSLNELCSFPSLCICMSCCSFLLIWVLLPHFHIYTSTSDRERQILCDVTYMWSLKYNQLVTITKINKFADRRTSGYQWEEGGGAYVELRD